MERKKIRGSFATYRYPNGDKSVSVETVANEKEEKAIFQEPSSLNVLHDLIVFDSKDYSMSKKDITLYAIVIGWDNASYKEFWDKGLLTMKQIERLRALHKQFNRLRAKS